MASPGTDSRLAPVVAGRCEGKGGKPWNPLARPWFASRQGLLRINVRKPLPCSASPRGSRERSREGKHKDRTLRSRQGDPSLRSFPDPRGSLSSLTAMELRLKAAPEYRVPVLSALEPLQQRAFEPVGIQPHAAPSLQEQRATQPEPSHAAQV